ncbi:MAG TPA: hypothetical protein VGB95_06655 [Chitinophagales bacterium]
MKKLTHDQIIRLRIIKAFGTTEERMFWLEWNAGMRYLENQCMGNQTSIDEMKSQPFYWRWFMQQWYAVNEMFLSDYAACAQPTWAMFIAFHKEFLGDENMSRSYMYHISKLTKIESRKVAEQYEVLSNPKLFINGQEVKGIMSVKYPIKK